MKITISHQHLTGNEPEDFNADAWMAALESEYIEAAKSLAPDAEIVVKFDVQRASGYQRPVSVDIDDDEEFTDIAALETSISYVANALYDARAEEFFN